MQQRSGLGDGAFLKAEINGLQGTHSVQESARLDCGRRRELRAQSCNGKMECDNEEDHSTAYTRHQSCPIREGRHSYERIRVHGRIRAWSDASGTQPPSRAHTLSARSCWTSRAHDMHTTPNSFQVTARWPRAAVTVGHASASRNYHQPTRTRLVLAREQTQRAREPASTANLCAGAVWPHAHRRALTVRSAPPTTSMTTSMASPSSSPTSAGCDHESGQAQAARHNKTSQLQWGSGSKVREWALNGARSTSWHVVRHTPFDAPGCALHRRGSARCSG